MSDSTDPRAGRPYIPTAQRCHRCGEMFVGAQACSAALEQECAPAPTRATTVDRDAETLSECSYCQGTGVCPGCGGVRMVEHSVRSSQLEHPLDDAAVTRRKP